ncbi:MAG: hypothetical protein PHI59_07680 [Candidatus Omnitrophica bacterium]|nr:hypothetical protein [Candidatus Omnitrophota bacterium]
MTNKIMCAIMVGVFAYSIVAVNRALLRIKYISIADNKLRAYYGDDQYEEYFIPNSIKKVEVVDKGVVHIHLDNGSQQFGLNTLHFCDRAELEAELEKIIPTVTINKDKTMERVSLFKAEPNKDRNTGVLTKGTGKDIPEIDRSQENKGKLGA